jgi:sugar lactone lactonase YvrE
VFVAGSVNGTGSEASFFYPNGLATDTSNSVYVADRFNNLICKITPAGVVMTFAGNAALV